MVRKIFGKIFRIFTNHSLARGSSGNERKVVFLPSPVIKFLKDEHLIIACCGVVVGILSGYTAVVFRSMIYLLGNLFMFHRISYHHYDPQFHVNGYLIVLVPAIGGLVVGFIVRYFAGEVKGHGVPEVMEAVTKAHGVIRPRIVLVKAIASAFCIGSGGSVGREGPIVHIGSALGSTIGQFLRIRADLLKILLGCGAAGGISATFNTPVSGVIFAFELLLLEFKTRSFVPLVISSVFATIISRIYLGQNPAFLVPGYSFVNPLELLFYLGLGVIAGLVAIFEVRLLYRIEDFFDGLRKIPDVLKPVIGGFLIGAIAIFYPQIMGTGYPVVSDALNEKMPLLLLLALGFFKIVALSLTLGSGGSGGVFAPTLFIGSMIGTGYGYMVHSLFPAITASCGAYGIVGMAAVFAGTTRATLTSIIMLFEMTRDYEIILPLMFSCVVADLISWKFQKDTIYTKKLSRRGTYIPADMQVNILDVKTAEDVMVRDVLTVTPRMSVDDVENTVAKSGHHGFPVIEHGRLVGIITDYDLTCCKGVGEREIKVRDLMQEKVITATPKDTLHSVFKNMLTFNISHIPVVDASDRKKLVGFITKRDILEVLSENV